MALKWLKIFNSTTGLKEKFQPITHASAVFRGSNNESTVDNDLDNVGAVKGAGTGSMQTVDSESTATGDYSNAFGKGNLAHHFQTIFGKWAEESIGTSESSTTIGSLFAVGNGTSEDSKSNALRLTTKGNLLIMGEYGTSGADYAEYFEWEDGNPYDDDRRGLFVTMEGKKIKVIDSDISESDFILGVVSSFPGVIGNADECWQGRWLKDDYGSFIIKDGSYVENPEYNPNKQYIPRSDRKEWDAIGMRGVLTVRDDGTCEVNGYCKPVSGGTATKSDTYERNSFRVIERVNDNLVKIVF